MDVHLAPVGADLVGARHNTSRIRAGQWCNGPMTLTDGDVADLAREAVDRKDPDLDISISPA
ncbi:MAG: hypothetical protein ACTHMS_20840, partial [Jatrophihabitans sp.]|uniref:hypothetical protein n=1 Tax=Jatrophihabitans sp. TaxID=1932789 RepID=UPI003F7F5E40